jgi:hypothetical protein
MYMKMKVAVAVAVVVVLPSSTYLFTMGVGGFDFHFITLKHTPQSVGLLWKGDQPVAGLYLTSQTLYTRQTPMPPVGFEPRSQQTLGRRPTP